MAEKAEETQEFPEFQDDNSPAQWYVAHTYSGYENKVKANIEKVVENRQLQNVIEQVVVPMHDDVEVKNGRKRAVQRKILPGYVLVKMVMNDETWYIVRNTRGVTSFVGPGSKPVALTEAEIAAMGIGAKNRLLEFEIGQSVKIKTGPFEGSVGVVEEINQPKKTLKIRLPVFGRDTHMEIDAYLLQKV